MNGLFVLQHGRVSLLCTEVIYALIGNELKCVTGIIPVDYHYMLSLDFLSPSLS